ncbi:MAG: TonB-dependent receptor, partial [Cyclobacteriaceae bacterium]|nr:TonB-dependent receptor [Cyclobacteriaceae bacterium]
IDKESNEGLPFANVFVNHTTLGTSTTGAGEFGLTVPSGKIEIITSYIGYQSFSGIVESKPNDTVVYDIHLKTEKTQLSEVEIKSTRDAEWEKQLVRFRKFFLGEGKLASQCEILNPWELDLTANQDELTAKSSQPIEIINRGLGYRLLFYLQNFHHRTKDYSILGDIFFEPLSAEGNQLTEWRKNRAEAYGTSLQAFVKSLAGQTTKDDGYAVYIDKPGQEKVRDRSAIFSNELNKAVIKFDPVSNIDRSTPGQLKIPLKGKLEIHHINAVAEKKTYKDVIHPVSWIESSSGVIELSTDGTLLNPKDILVSGYLSQFRVSNLLPSDYDPKADAMLIEEPSTRLSTDRYQRLQEKIYLHTNKAFYYPGDVIWWKAYMSYSNWELRDSLSRVIYVEVISPDRKVVVHNQFAISEGRSFGQLILPEDFSPGLYYLRAYTRWMLNYPYADIFLRKLPILEFNEIITGQRPNEAQISNVKVNLTANKKTYALREKIDVAVKLTDAENNPLAANLSVSVTDVELITPLQIGPSIDQQLKINPRKIRINQIKPANPLELGIGLSGEFRNAKKKRVETAMMVVQGNMEDMAQVTTSSQGDFFISGFQFYDSASIAFRPLVGQGTVKLLKKPVPTFYQQDGANDFTIQKASAFYRPSVEVELSKDSKLLEQVVIKAERIQEDRVKMGITYGRPDHVLTGAQLNSGVVGGNLVEALAGKIPGLSVTWSWDPVLSTKHYHLRIRGGSSSIGVGGTIEPLILLDGIPFASRFDNLNTVGDFLVGIQPEAVDRIEVITRANPLFGVSGTNGVIAIYTKGSSLAQSQPTLDNSLKDFQSFMVKGYEKALPFRSPDYSKNRNVTEKDFRSTLYWDPNITTTENGEAKFTFFAADLPTTYLIVVEGVTSEGKPFRAERTVQVVK